jgi:hypothetical protein
MSLGDEYRSTRKGQGNTDFIKFFVFDVLVATVFGLVSFLVTRDQIVSFLLSLVIATILLLVELRFQVASSKEDIARAVGIQRAAMDDRTLMVTAERVVDAYTEIARSGDEMFLGRAREVLGACDNQMTKLREGYIEFRPDETYAYVMRMFREAEKNVFGTVFVRVTDFWFRGAGKEYLAENYRTIKRGVKITRVFIVESSDELTEEVVDLMKSQAANGIDVKIAFARNLGGDLLHDMGLWDDKYAAYMDLVPGSKEMRGSRLYRDEGEIRRALNIRERVLQESEDAASFFARFTPQQADEDASATVTLPTRVWTAGKS